MLVVPVCDAPEFVCAGTLSCSTGAGFCRDAGAAADALAAAMGASDGTGKPANPNPVISLAGSRVVQLARYTDYVVCRPGPAAAAAAATSAAKLGLVAPLLGRIKWINLITM